MYSKAFTADGYSYVVQTTGGKGAFQCILTSGTGTLTLKYCPPDGDISAAASFTAYDSDTTVTANALIGVNFIEGYYVLQVSSGSSPVIAGKLIGAKDAAFRVINTTPA